MFDNWYSCLFTLVLLFLLSKNDRSGSSPQGGFVCFSALLSCFQTKMIFFLDYVRVYPFSESRISSVRVKTWFRSKKCLRCKRRFVCFGMNFKSIIWFRVKLCLSARENARWMLKRKCFFYREYVLDRRNGIPNNIHTLTIYNVLSTAITDHPDSECLNAKSSHT